MDDIVIVGEWYQCLVTDCKAIVTERLYRSRQEVIEGWHEVGERIATDKNYQKELHKWGNGKIRKKLAEDIGASVKTLYFAIQFYNKFPKLSNALDNFEEGKNISWHKIVQNYLPAPKDETPALPSDKYRVIYADPPWKYFSGEQSKPIPYNSMTIPELCALPIKDMAQENSVLFMWVTSPLLAECFEVINAWGFTYKASIVWNKDAHNVGHYVSVRHEFLLICTRGSCRPDISELLPSVVTEKRTEHSVKPEVFRQMIDTMYPEGKRIELFARVRVDGWDAWGNDDAI